MDQSNSKPNYEHNETDEELELSNEILQPASALDFNVWISESKKTRHLLYDDQTEEAAAAAGNSVLKTLNSVLSNINKQEIDEDAASKSSHSVTVMDLNTAIEESKKAIQYLYNNQIDKAISVFKPWCNSSMYHSIGNTSYMFLRAVLHYDQEDIKTAIEEVNKTIKLCDRFRRKQTYLNTLKKLMNVPFYGQYSSEEIHAELIYAESLSIKSTLAFLDDKSNAFGFIKAGLKLRNAFNCYKECDTLLNYLLVNKQKYDVDFESGVRVGVGIFNLIISHLPSRIIRLLELVGFSGNREVGLNEIMKCYNLSDGLRHIGSVMLILIYNLLLVYFVGNCEGDLDLCDKILTKHLNIYPDCAIFTYFKGRFEFLNGDTEGSMRWYMKSCNAQTFWPHLHHFCYWEMTWIYIFTQNWKEAEMYADIMVRESKWSRTLFYYQKACIKLMRFNELTEDEKIEIETLMNEAPKYKQRIAGKSLPMEKFCIKKSIRYNQQNKYLALPIYELLFFWNLFKPLGKSESFILKVYDSIKEERKYILENSNKETKEFEIDNQALLLFLEGNCLFHMTRYTEAEEVINSVLALKDNIKDDYYIIPYSLVKLANIYINKGNTTKAINILEDVKANYTGYSLENQLHFQIHAILQELKGSNQKISHR